MKRLPSGECDGDAGFLYGRRLLPALLEDAHQQLTFQAEVLKLITLCGRDIASLHPAVFLRQVQLALPPLPAERNNMSQSNIAI